MSVTFKVDNGPKHLTTYYCYLCQDDAPDPNGTICHGRGEYEVENDVYSVNFCNSAAYLFITAISKTNCGRLPPAKVKAAIPAIKSVTFDMDRQAQLLRVFEWAAENNKSVSWS